MAEVGLFHHAQGLTTGVQDFAQSLRDAGHTVHTPDLYDGQTFDTLDDGLAYLRTVGFDTVLERGRAAGEALPADVVWAGFSLGVMPAQLLAQTRPGARGALLMESCVPPSEFSDDGWPDDVPVQVHGMEEDPIFAGEGDLEAARALVAEAADGELFTYPGTAHLFADDSIASYDEEQAAALTERVIAFLDRVS
jgi:dienelactone hydrolase